ncbi:hypothetical protein [Halorussus salinisoli]|uniref:hypothetical protein n=1 Tax=Halorussus salinisoli TaxID=2558242 RepID=UPI0010C1F0AC|nr:hypothetical protein [Halorussus salinisoli]
MARQITVSSTTSIADSGDVCHFDELSETAKGTLTRLVNDETTAGIESEAADELAQYDVIKFTEYITVSYDGSSASGSVSA